MFCINCGRDVPDGNKYCIYCGVWMDAPEEPVNTAVQPAVQSDEQTFLAQPVQPSFTPAAQPQIIQEPVHTYAAQPVQPYAAQPVQIYAAQPAQIAENTVTATAYPMPEVKKKRRAPVILLSLFGIIVAAVVAISLLLAGGDTDTGEADRGGNNITQSLPAAQPQLTPGGAAEENVTTSSYVQPPIADSSDSVAVQPQTNANTGIDRPAAGNYASICQTYNDKIYNFRAYILPVTMEKSQTIDLHIADNYNGPDMLKNTFNSMLGMLAEPTVATYNFNNSSDGNGSTIYDRTMPWGRDARVSPSDISYANVYDNSDGGYTIELRFVSEYSYYDGNSMTEPIHHQSAMDPLNFGTLDISPLEISSADTYYPGAVIKLTVDAKGRMSYFDCSVPMETTCTAGVGPVKAEISLEGSMDTTYNITYQS